jgi:sulfite oxidase
VALRDVLMASGPLDAATDIAISGVDRVERNGATFGFGGSIPLSKAMDPDVVLADEMNGEPLPAVHGGPVRLVVPGYIGARSVKWVGDLEARDRPSENYFQTEAYRIQSQPDPRDPRSVRQGRALGETALNSVILSPAEDAVVRAGGVILEGWAIGGGGRGVSRVEVSPDGGTRWIPARVEQGAGRWTWQRWTATVNLQPGRAVLLVRAFDDTGAGQPDRIGDAWNVKGYGNNAWHRVLVWAVG